MIVAAFLASLVTWYVHAAPPKAAPPPIPLPALPVLARITVDPTQAEDRVLITHDFVIDRGEYHGGDLVFYAAYGGPAIPLAMDAHVFSGPTLPALSTHGDAAIVEPRPRKPDRVDWVVGRASQAGAAIRVPAATLAKIWDAGPSLIIRVRAVHRAQRDPRGERDAIVRLGVAASQPITVLRVDVRGSTRASARTCHQGTLGERVILHDADTGRRLDLADLREPSTFYERLDPSALQRAAEDDLCIAF